MPNFKLFIKSTEAVSLLSRVSREIAGMEAYVVGGFIRDTILGRETADMDIAVAADGCRVAERLALALGGSYVLLDPENRVGRVVLPGWQMDFSGYTGSIQDDLGRRDFTIDAMAASLEMVASGEALLLDPFHGRADLKNKTIRAVSEGIFRSDAARLLRAMRLAAEMSFRIEKDTEDLIKRDGQLIMQVAGERVREEMLRLLAVPGNQAWQDMEGLGLLAALLPELDPARGNPQPAEHHWDILQHSIQAVEAADFLLRKGDWAYGHAEVLAAAPWSEELAAYFGEEVSPGSDRRILLKLATLLHDIAKPQTKAVDSGGRTRFLGHATEGAAVTARLMERLRFSTKEIRLVETLVEHHLRPMQMTAGGLPSHRAIYRFFRDTGEAGTATLFLSLADHLATRGPGLDMEGWREHTKLAAYVLEQKDRQEEATRPPRLVDGHDLALLFGLAPGPRMGEVLEQVREAQAAGEIVSREEALAYVRKMIKPVQPGKPRAAVVRLRT